LKTYQHQLLHLLPEIDVSDQESVNAARAEIGEKTDVFDALINNAGIMGGMQQTATNTDVAVYKQVFDTNFLV
jgi:NADP-dependent 3-hydroxy acid dehydrogenase YdfG